MTTKLVEQVGALDTDEKAEFLEQALGALTIGECLALVERLEENWEVESTPRGPIFGPRPDLFEKEEDDQTEFAVEIKEVGQKKIAVVKAIRALTNLSLKESKDLVDKAPVLVQENLSKEDADKAKADLEAVGATVSLQ